MTTLNSDVSNHVVHQPPFFLSLNVYVLLILCLLIQQKVNINYIHFIF